jgi:hypothetical protein
MSPEAKPGFKGREALLELLPDPDLPFLLNGMSTHDGGKPRRSE